MDKILEPRFLLTCLISLGVIVLAALKAISGETVLAFFGGVLVRFGIGAATPKVSRVSQPKPAKTSSMFLVTALLLVTVAPGCGLSWSDVLQRGTYVIQTAGAVGQAGTAFIGITCSVVCSSAGDDSDHCKRCKDATEYAKKTAAGMALLGTFFEGFGGKSAAATVPGLGNINVVMVAPFKDLVAARAAICMGVAPTTSNGPRAIGFHAPTPTTSEARPGETAGGNP